jgi:ribosomal protein S27E
MRFCKDCWFLWKEKGICTNRNITKINPVNDTPMSLAIDLRQNGGEGYCNSIGNYWRPKAYSPTKVYKFQVECPDCGRISVFTLNTYQDDGMRVCSKCEKMLYMPGYGKNTLSPKLIPKQPAGWMEFMETMKNVKV